MSTSRDMAFYFYKLPNDYGFKCIEVIKVNMKCCIPMTKVYHG